MNFLSNNLPLILCGLAGLGLLIGEAFMPGFGLAGILGIVLEIIAVYSAWLHHGLVFALILTVVLLLVISSILYFTYRSVLHGRLSRSNLVLSDAEIPVPEVASKTLSGYLGQEGTAATALRPGGLVEIDGQRVNASSTGDFIEKGISVKVTGLEGDHVLVQTL